MSNEKAQKTQVNGSKAKAEKGNGINLPKTEAPTKEQVRDWIRKDLKSAIYFLSYLELIPGLLDELSARVYEDAQKGPQLPTENQN